ncbi:hypothetical protein BDV18DRAFT_129701 [Aspergillus unguis]
MLPSVLSILTPLLSTDSRSSYSIVGLRTWYTRWPRRIRQVDSLTSRIQQLISPTEFSPWRWLSLWLFSVSMSHSVFPI